MAGSTSIFRMSDWRSARLTICLAVLFLGLPGRSLAQSEGGAVHDEIQFQEIGHPEKQFVLRKGKQISIPLRQERGFRMVRGRVDELGDSSLVVKEKRTGFRYTVDLRRAAYFKRFRPGWAWPGRILIGLGGVAMSLGLIIGLLFLGFNTLNGGFAFLVSVAYGLTFGLPLIGLGILFLVLAWKKVFLREWSFRRVRRKVVRKLKSSR